MQYRPRLPQSSQYVYVQPETSPPTEASDFGVKQEKTKRPWETELLPTEKSKAELCVE